MKRIAVAGATGFVGHALIEILARQYQVVALTRSSRLSSDSNLNPTSTGVVWKKCDLFSLLDAENALENCDIAVYLVHSMMPNAKLTQGRFEDLDLLLADNFARAAAKAGVKKIVYLGGIIPAERPLSRHLASRLEVEQALASQGVPVLTLRAGLIVGPQGSSAEMMIKLVSRLPVLICPAWTRSQSSPLSLRDVLELLAFAINTPDLEPGHYDVGGPEAIDYQDMLMRTAAVLGVRRRFVSIPFFHPSLSKLWVSVVSGSSISLVGPLVSSLRHSMLPANNKLAELAGVKPLSFEEALKQTLRFPPPPKAPATKHVPPKLVCSVQRLHLPQGRKAEWVAREYARWLPDFFKPVLRVVTDQRGHMDFHIFWFKRPLLKLEFSEARSQPERSLYYIRGGVLAAVSQQSKARLEFREVLNGRALIVAIFDFEPALPWFFYKFSQALVHLFVMWSFGRYLRNVVPQANSSETSLNAQANSGDQEHD